MLLSNVARRVLLKRTHYHVQNERANDLRIDVAERTCAEARFNVPATGGKEHRLIRVELSRLCKRTRLFGI